MLLDEVDQGVVDLLHRVGVAVPRAGVARAARERVRVHGDHYAVRAPPARPPFGAGSDRAKYAGRLPDLHTSFTPRRESLALAGLHLAVLWAFAFAQPLLDLLGDTPEFFVARGNTRGDILLLAVGAGAGPAARADRSRGPGRARVGAPARMRCTWCLVAALTAAFVLQLIKDVSVRSALLLAAALAVGALAALAYERTAAGPAVLTVLSPAPLVFLFVFLVLSPVSKLVLPGDDVAAAEVDVPGRAPVVVILFDEFAGYTLQRARTGGSTPRAIPTSPGWPRRHLVPQRDHRRRLHRPCGARAADRRAPRQGVAADRLGPPREPVHAARRRLLARRDRAGDRRLPERLCPEEAAAREPETRRLRDLASDLSLVSLHLLLPEPLRQRAAAGGPQLRRLPRVDDPNAADVERAADVRRRRAAGSRRSPR